MTVQDDVNDYIDQRPYIQEALAEEIINYSALARSMQDEIDGGFEAIKMALRRYQQEKAEQRVERHQAITAVLGDTSVTITNNITVCKSETTHKDCHIRAETESGPTAILEGSDTESHDTITGQALVTLSSPTDLEETPGVMAYILSLLAGRGINVTELLSCREDTHLVIDEADATAVFELLSEKL